MSSTWWVPSCSGNVMKSSHLAVVNSSCSGLYDYWLCMEINRINVFMQEPASSSGSCLVLHNELFWHVNTVQKSLWLQLSINLCYWSTCDNLTTWPSVVWLAVSITSLERWKYEANLWFSCTSTEEWIMFQPLRLAKLKIVNLDWIISLSSAEVGSGWTRKL